METSESSLKSELSAVFARAIASLKGDTVLTVHEARYTTGFELLKLAELRDNGIAPTPNFKGKSKAARLMLTF